MSVVWVKFVLECVCQRPPSLPLTTGSFRQIERAKITVPKGRSAKLSDVIIRHYSITGNWSMPKSYRLKEIDSLLTDPAFVLSKPTVVYAHGYVELASDSSVTTIVRAYLDNAGFNVLLLDWANLAFGPYIAVALDVQPIGVAAGRALSELVRGGVSLEGLHLVGHSLGAHLLAFAARFLDAEGRKVPRLTGLDPAFPGFYPPLLSASLGSDDATFVDVIHTDGGGYGAPDSIGHADFWPNEGRAKQPGCLPATILFTVEDFCSHWRSWAYWAESVSGGAFLARACTSYDSFLRGECAAGDLVDMGLRASPDLKGNFYLRTATMAPFALGERGAE